MGTTYSDVDINTLLNGSKESTIALVICLVIGGLGCFFGYKLTKVFIAICGFAFGVLIGTILGGLMRAAAMVFLLGLGLGIVFAIFSYKAYKFGVFLTSFLMVGLFAASVMIVITKNNTKPVMELAVGAVAGIIGGIVAVKITKPIMIITSSLSFGSLFGTMLAFLIKMPKIVPILEIVSIILGLIVQVKTNGGLLETEDEKRPSQNYAAPQYVNPYATGNNYNNYNGYNQFGGQQQPFQGGMNGQQGYMNGQPGTPGGQPPQDDGFLGNGHLPQ